MGVCLSWYDTDNILYVHLIVLTLSHDYSEVGETSLKDMVKKGNNIQQLR